MVAKSGMMMPNLRDMTTGQNRFPSRFYVISPTLRGDVSSGWAKRFVGDRFG